MEDLTFKSGVPEDFLFCIFTSDPTRDTVRVIIDDGTIKFSMRRDRFANIIKDLCGQELEKRVRFCMSEYGTSYLLDRQNLKLEHLSPAELDNFNIANIGKDARKNANSKRVNINDAFAYAGSLRREDEARTAVWKPKFPGFNGMVDYRKK
jgi:hypothetical protein